MVHSLVCQAEETPHRKRAVVSGDVIKPTRCKDQGTSYCFTNLLLPHRGGGGCTRKLNELLIKGEMPANRPPLTRPALFCGFTLTKSTFQWLRVCVCVVI